MLTTLFTSILLGASSVVCLPSEADGLGDVHARDRAIKRQSPAFIGTFWDVDTPTPSDFSGSTSFYDMHLDAGDGWFVLPTDAAGEELNTSGDRVGYRLTNDPGSSIIWTFSSDNTVVTGDLFDGTGPDDDIGFSIDMNGNLDAAYTSTTPSNASSTTDPWTSTSTGTPVILGKSLQIQNSECNGSLNFTATTVDANGVTEIFNGIDNLDVTVPTALPANVTITSSNTTAGVVLTYTGVEPVSVLLGDGGNAPVPRASLGGVVQYCPD